MKFSNLFNLILGLLFIGLMTACNGFQSTIAEGKAEKTVEELAVMSTNATTSTMTCLAKQSWVTSPSLPSEIPDKGANFCDFYQFSWQSFLYLMSPSSGDASIRNFEDVANFPILQNSNSCSGSPTTPNLFVRMVKDDDNSPEFIIPEAIGQAGGGATIYDQMKNVVYYSVSFSEDLCAKAQSPNPTAGNLPTNTIEMKLAWRVIDDTQTGDFVSMQADIVKNDGSDKMTTLGLVGFHLVQGTPLHPEFVWASYEHKNNAPNCIDAAAAPATGWSFTSTTCSACLITPDQTCYKDCPFNMAEDKATSLTGTPSEICRVFPEGTALGDLNGDENQSIVNALNSQLVGTNGYVTALDASNPLHVISNYMNIGALWVTDPTKPATSTPDFLNQRGSMQLENPVMETVFQGTLNLDSVTNELHASTGPATGTLNCFTCHAYTPNKTASTGLSHIYSSILKQASTSAKD